MVLNDGWSVAVDYIRCSYNVSIDTLADARVNQLIRHYGASGRQRAVVWADHRGVRLDGLGVTIARQLSSDRIVEIVSGPSAATWTPPTWATELRISRVDIALDAIYKTVNPDNAVHLADNVIDVVYTRYADMIDRGYRQWQRRRLTRISNHHGGTTVYVGSRRSDHFLRVYNKTAELRDIDRWIIHDAVVRYEIEIKGNGIERHQLVDYLAAGDRDWVTAVAKWMIDYYDIAMTIDAPTMHVPMPRRPTDDERKLRWIRERVVPTLAHLTELGYGDDLRDMGITYDYTTKTRRASIWIDAGETSETDDL